MRPYKELCRVNRVSDLRLIKALLNKHHIEYFVQGDPFSLLLLHLKDAVMCIMVRHEELLKAKKILTLLKTV